MSWRDNVSFYLAFLLCIVASNAIRSIVDRVSGWCLLMASQKRFKMIAQSYRLSYNTIMKRQLPMPAIIDHDHYYSFVMPNEDCLEWHGAISRGYGKYKGLQAHRVAWFLETGDDPVGFYVLHRCDNRTCVNIDHLYLGTQSDNMRDMWKRGGRKHNNAIAKYTWEQICEIRTMHKTGKYSLEKIGRCFGMNRSMVYKIVNYHTWKVNPNDH